MGDYIAIRYNLKIKPEHRAKLSHENMRREATNPLNWERMKLQFSDPAQQRIWQQFLLHDVSKRFPDACMLHYNPQNWEYIRRYYGWETGEMRGTDCHKVIPGGVQMLVQVLPLIADEWKVEVAIKDLLLSNGNYEWKGCEPVDIYSHEGNDLFADRLRKVKDDEEKEFGGQWGFR